MARVSGEGRGESERPSGETGTSFPSRSPFSSPAQKFFVLAAHSPSGFDPAGLGHVRGRMRGRGRA